MQTGYNGDSFIHSFYFKTHFIHFDPPSDLLVHEWGTPHTMWGCNKGRIIQGVGVGVAMLCVSVTEMDHAYILHTLSPVCIMTTTVLHSIVCTVCSTVLHIMYVRVEVCVM